MLIVNQNSMSGKAVKPYKQLVRYAVRGLKALDRTVPADVLAHAVDFGLDPDQLSPRFIHSMTAGLVNDAYPGLFDDDDIETFLYHFVPAKSLEDL